MVYCVSNAIFVSVSLNPPDNLAKLVCYLPFLDEAGEAIEVTFGPDLVLLVSSKCLHWKLVFLTPESLLIIELEMVGVGWGRDLGVGVEGG